MAGEVLVAVVGAGGLVLGGLITSVIGSRSSELTQLHQELSLLRQALDRRHTHLSAYARTLEIVLLAWQLPSVPEQIETIRKAREALEHALGSSGGGGGGR